MSIKRILLCALWAFGSIPFWSSSANAHTYTYQCTGTPGELEARINGSSAWTTTDGGPGTTAILGIFDIVKIDGTTNSEPCPGDIFVRTVFATFENHSGTNTLIPADEIDGMFEVWGTQITIDGIALTCSACSSSTSNTSGLSDFTENGALTIHDGAVALFENGQITGSKTSGIFAIRSSSISLFNATIVGNGQTGSAGPFSNGIFAGDGSSVRLANPDGSGAVTIAGNGKSGGGCPGYGLFLEEDSSLITFAATIGGAGTTSNASSQNTCGQILMEAGSSALLEGTTINETTANQAAVQLVASSSLIAETNSASMGTSIDSGNNGAMLVGGASSALLNSTEIQSTGTTVPTIEAAATSTLALAGNNTISAVSPGGTVFQIDHASILTQVNASEFGFTDVPESINGSAFVQVQSSIDVGRGLFGGNPSISWSVPAGDCILVQQNSSFRMSGGVAISGAPAAACGLNGGATSSTITIQQESNGFFNLVQGGTDVINGGGGVSCLFAGIPNAHVTGKANITPAGAQPVVFGSLMQALTATSPGCLGP